MRVWIIICLTAACILLHGCTGTAEPSKQISSDCAADSISETEADPFALEEPPAQEADARFGFGMSNPPEDGTVPFSDEVALPFWVENTGAEADFRVFVFADGILQDIRIAEEQSPQFTAQRNERKELTAMFRPVTAGAEPAALTWALMFGASYTPESETAQFGHYLRMNTVSLFRLSNGFAEAQNDIVSVKAVPVSERVQQKYKVMREGGLHNRLTNVTFFTCENVLGSTNTNSVRRSDSVILRLAGGALTGTWRISAYCDHQLVPAFDGRHYLDMTADANNMSEYTVSLSGFPNPANQYGTLYFLAVPLDTGHDLLQTHPMVLVRDTA